jgi:hypothetical protein
LSFYRVLADYKETINKNITIKDFDKLYDSFYNLIKKPQKENYIKLEIDNPVEKSDDDIFEHYKISNSIYDLIF